MAIPMYLYCKFVYANGSIRLHIAGSMSKIVGDGKLIIL